MKLLSYDYTLPFTREKIDNDVLNTNGMMKVLKTDTPSPIPKTRYFHIILKYFTLF